MILAALIRKRTIGDLATATPAIAATQTAETIGTVARIATIAVANHPNGQTGEFTTSWGWLLHYPASDPVQVFCLPEPTHVEVLAMYPDAVAAEPIPERTRIKPTPEQEVEWQALWGSVGASYTLTRTEQQEALALALNDPDAVSQSYQATAPKPGIALDHDDRRYCDKCTNLRRDVCTIAEPKIGALVVANRGYRPVREPPRRCAGYTPGPDDPDRRLGLERWPKLIEEGE